MLQISLLHRILFLFLLLLSGLAGISYEILYARILGNIIGDQWAVSASILLTFLLGIGVGTLHAHRMWRYLWMIEAGVGLYAILFVLGAETINTWLYYTSSLFGIGLPVNILQCTILLGIPAFLIGCSLPLFAGYLNRLISGLAFSRAYAIHTLGGALTILLVEFCLLRQVGLQQTVLVIAALNISVAVMLRVAFGQLRDLQPETPRYIHFPKRHLAALVIASIASAIFQLWAVKVAEFLVGPFRETFALVLALVLLGIVLGTWASRRLRLGFDWLMLLNLLGLIWILVGTSIIAEFYAAQYSQAADSHTLTVLLKLAALSMLIGIPALTFGATVPALISQQVNVARESGQLLFISSVANAFGFLVMVFLLHQHLDYGEIIIAVVVLTSLALLIYSWFTKMAVAAVALILPCVLWAGHSVWNENLLYLGYNSFHSPQLMQERGKQLKFLETYKGEQDVFAIYRTKIGEAFFFINGYISINLNSPAEKTVAAFSSLFAPRMDRALVLGTGSGATAGTVGLLFGETDTVEINPVVLKNLHRMAEYNFNILDQPSVNIINDDAMHYTKLVDKTYSLIINTVTSPLYFSSAKLYTQDFFELIKKRLQPDGVYVTWLDSRVGDRGLDIILKTLSRSFKSCWMGYIKDSYLLLACSQEQMALHQPHSISNHEILKEDFLKRYYLVADWLPYQLVSTQALDLIDDHHVPVNTLDYPALEFEMARLQRRGIDKFYARLLQAMSVADLAAALSPVMEWRPELLAMQARISMGDSYIGNRWTELLRQEQPGLNQYLYKAETEYYRRMQK